MTEIRFIHRCFFHHLPPHHPWNGSSAVTTREEKPDGVFLHDITLCSTRRIESFAVVQLIGSSSRLLLLFSSSSPAIVFINLEMQ